MSNTKTGTFLDIPYDKIRDHCKIARCTGGCPNSGEVCVKEINKDSDGTPVVSCECQADTCRKEYNFRLQEREVI